MNQRGRPATGHIRRRSRSDGKTTFALRVRAYGSRHHIRLGSEAEGWSDARAEIELDSVLAQIRAGTWSPPTPQTSGTPIELPSFHEYASMWFKRHIAEGISDNTRKDLLWQLSNHLLPYFESYRLDEITHELVEAFKDYKLDERARIVVAAEAGEVVRDASGRARRPLSNTSINKFLTLLARICETAVRRGWLPTNPTANVDRLRVRRRKGPILEADELESLITAAGAPGRPQSDGRRAAVREMRDRQQLSWRVIGERLGIASSTAVYLYRARPAERADDGRRALIAVLGCGGLRATEAADLNVADVNLLHRKIFVRDSKTDAGVRQVDMSPRLARELEAYLGTRPTVSPADPAFPTRTGARREKDNIRNRVVAPALKRANQDREAAGLPLIGVHVTPHALRRTYISLMLSAGAEVPYVQEQVGHADAKVTLEIYAQVLKRRDRRRFGDAFDALMQDAIPSMHAAKMLDYRRPISQDDGARRQEITA
jgi:integrase